MESLPDYYGRLGVDPGATREVISQTYRRLVRKYHPDINKAPGALERFKYLTEAYEVLDDPPKRAAYDRERRTATAQQTGYVPGGMFSDAETFMRTVRVTRYPSGDQGQSDDFSDLFAEFFGATPSIKTYERSSVATPNPDGSNIVKTTTTQNGKKETREPQIPSLADLFKSFFNKL